MNIVPHLPPGPVSTPEVPRPAHPPAHESSRPVIAPNPGEAMAQETRRDDTRRADRNIEHDTHPRSPQEHRRAADTRAAAETPSPSEPHPHNLTVGALLDVFA